MTPRPPDGRLPDVQRVPNPRAAADWSVPENDAMSWDIHGTRRAFRGMAYEELPERRLMVAVLEDAIRTLLLARRTAVPRKRLLRELAWVESTSQTEPFAFESICDVLGLDSGYLRQRLVSGAFVPARAGAVRGPRTSIRRSVDPRNRACLASY